MAVVAGNIGIDEPSSIDKRVDTNTMTRGVEVHREVVSIGSADAATPERFAVITSGGAITVDGSATTQPVSGTVTANQGTAAAASGAWPVKPTDAAGTNQLAITATGDAKVTLDGESVAVTGTVTADAGTGPWPITDNGGDISIDDGGNTITVDGTVTANQGTPAATANAWPTKIVDSAGTNVVAVTATGDLKVTLDSESVPITAASALEIEGDVDHDAPGALINPVIIGSAAWDDLPVKVGTQADCVRAWLDLYGRQVVSLHHAPKISAAGHGPKVTTVSTTGNTALVAAPGAGFVIVVTMIAATNTHASDSIRLDLKDDTTTKVQMYLAATGGGFVMPFHMPWVINTNNALNAALNAAHTDVRVTVHFYTMTTPT